MAASTDSVPTTVSNIIPPASIHSDTASTASRRSSSQASRASSHSRQAKLLRGTSKKGSKSKAAREHEEDASLTSFPSFPPDEEAILATEEEQGKPERTISQRVKARKATLAGLTSPGIIDRSNALFDDSPRSSLDIPGSLHLSTDEHIERLIRKVGAIKLIRQYAHDLAQRDAEISALRVRSDERERELKKLLREADVPSAAVEKRLLRLENPIISTNAKEDLQKEKRASLVSIDNMMNEAITDSRSLSPLQTTFPPQSKGLPEPPPALTVRLKSRLPPSQLQNQNVLSGESSRANSVKSGEEEEEEDLDSTIRMKSPGSTSRVSSLQGIFQPPTNSTSYFIGGSNKTLAKTKAVDEISVKSTQSGKSNTSWTRFFGGRSQPSRSRASSVDQTGTSLPDDLSSLVAKSRPVGNRGSTVSANTKRPQGQRSVTSSRVNAPVAHARKESNASSLPPTVELDSMIESSQLPPTMSNYNSEGLLVDRFGFIYDRKRKRNQLQAQRHGRQKLSVSEKLANLRSGENTNKDDNQSHRPATPVSVDEDPSKKSWQDYLLPSANQSTKRPRELLAHTPSAGAVVTVSTADAEGTLTPPRIRDLPISLSTTTHKALPTVSSMSEAQPSNVTAVSADFLHEAEEEAGEVNASKALLDQLTELHDNLQAERVVKWNDFLRRVRAERSTTATERSSNNAPEADLVNGELIGIATLGRSNKTKAKYMHFKTLVLAGIPVALRPKVWAECSGASSLRVPGYFEDLLARSQSDAAMEPDILQQIQADVKRTLRDNVFFRDPTAPGVQRLEELLRVYSIHNPKIGYCQGMNLITASLLLICATSEDCFWLLVTIIDYILPSGYFDQNLLVARADQMVLRGYVAEVLPRLDAKLQDLGVELEACTFHWFLSLYTGILTGGEALYRIWDVTLCLNSSDSAPMALQNKSAAAALGVEGYLNTIQPTTPTTPVMPPDELESTINSGEHDGTSSPFLFQLSLALLKLNEEAILALESPAQVYTYLNHNMTAHNITIDALVNASEMLRSRIKRTDVLDRRKKAVESLR